MHRRDATSPLWVAVAVAVANYATPRFTSSRPMLSLPLCLGWRLGLAFHAPPVRLPTLSYSLVESCTAW